MGRVSRHWIRASFISGLIAAMAGTAAFAYDRAAETPRDVLTAQDETMAGIDFMITGPVSHGAAEATVTQPSAAGKSPVRHRMRRH